MRRKSIKTDLETTWMIVLVDKNIMTIIIIVFHMFKKPGKKIERNKESMELLLWFKKC